LKDLDIALIQADLDWENPESNLSRFGNVIGSLSGTPDIILLPEMFNTGFSINPLRFAETMEGPSAGFLRRTARERGAMVVASLMIREGERFFNRLVCMLPDGSVKFYNKRHLFRLSEEFRLITPGTERVVIEYLGWKILLLVCYDLRFPVWTKNRYLSGSYEYDLILLAANWPANRSHVWKTLLTARAMENQCYVAGVNRIGTDGFGTPHRGESIVLDPRGNALYTASPDAGEVITARLLPEELKQYRDSFTVGLDWDLFNLQEG